jgi:hypothetical protein
LNQHHLLFTFFSHPIPTDKPDTIENVFAILNKAQLSFLFPQIIRANDNISYVGTSFYLTNSYLKDTGNKEKYMTALKGIADLKDDVISKSSKGMIYYLIYKIDKKENNLIEATEYLQKCEKETPSMYKHLIAQDQYYNLDSLQIKITSHKN